MDLVYKKYIYIYIYIIYIYYIYIYIIRDTVKPVYNDHLGDEVSSVVIDMWSL